MIEIAIIYLDGLKPTSTSNIFLISYNVAFFGTLYVFKLSLTIIIN